MGYYTEYLVKKQNDLKMKLLKIGIIALAIYLIITITAIVGVSKVNPQILVFTNIGIIYGAYFLISKLNFEFEYIITNDDFDIDKIIAQGKRKRVDSFSIKEISQICQLSNANIDKSYPLIDASSGSKDKTIHYFIKCKTKKNPIAQIIITPNEKILTAIKENLPRGTEIK